MKTTTIQEMADKVLAASAHKTDFRVGLHEFVAGMDDIATVNNGVDEYVLTPNGLKNLMKDRLKINPVTVLHPDVNPANALAVVRDIALAQENREIQVRCAGQNVEAIVSGEYSFFDNATIVTALLSMQMQGDIPEDARVMSSYISRNARSLEVRLVAPEDWSFVIGENGSSANFNGNLVIANNEIAQGGFKAQVAITRNDCLNTTIGKSLFDVTHRFAQYQEFYDALIKGVGQVKGWSEEMRDMLESYQAIPIESPMLIFERIGEELGVPKYAISSNKGQGGAVEYWKGHGEGGTLYDVVQAVSAGARVMTDIATTRREPKWEKRAATENGLWTLSEALHSMHNEGQQIEDWYYTGDQGAIEKAARYVEGFQKEVPQALMIADGIRENVEVG
jgi:hypothetical protein